MLDLNEMEKQLDDALEEETKMSLTEWKILRNLHDYFESTSKEGIEKDWEDCSAFDSVGMTSSDFIEMIEEQRTLL